MMPVNFEPGASDFANGSKHKPPTLRKIPTDLADQLNLMDELNKNMHEMPISIMQSGSLTVLNKPE